MSPTELRNEILKMVAEHENGPGHDLFSSQRISDVLGIQPRDVFRQLDILESQRMVRLFRTSESYGVKMEPAGWTLLEQAPAQTNAGQTRRVLQAEAYTLHPEIRRVSEDLYKDGHFKSAAFEAYVYVINAVKIRSGSDLDGEKLMNRVFGSENQAPMIRFNSLQTEAERDEQRGFMNLFKGVVGLRNTKAHTNAVLDSPERAFEYLALASLLARLLDLSPPEQTTVGV